ncbi:hypothetical protein CJF31_00003167 [Rutstroemia sp. NJR-2017a BVV2]|nr:hypothetical protein CJF31_00001959 [Rutstroemia sp. NJR-2017a BVV2]PQE18514.1 hypothetical protein CJF31_00003167 [Rutstroemia sp. NJR-2017a BVV2]
MIKFVMPFRIQQHHKRRANVIGIVVKELFEGPL